MYWCPNVDTIGIYFSKSNSKQVQSITLHRDYYCKLALRGLPRLGEGIWLVKDPEKLDDSRLHQRRRVNHKTIYVKIHHKDASSGLEVRDN